jgi:cell division protein FtsI (penicillin-binding protein 3)
MEFCGYFPSQKPQYTIIVCLDKVGLPASANHSAGKIYKEVVDYIIQMEEENS